MDKVICKNCKSEIVVKGRYHAGLSDSGFLYCSKDGTVLTFNAYDPGFERASDCRACVPWQLTEDQRRRVEENLIHCPCGGVFSFKNPLKCPVCGAPFAEPMTKDIYFYVLDRVIDGEKVRVWKDLDQ